MTTEKIVIGLLGALAVVIVGYLIARAAERWYR